jgi:hypothetical protein
MNTTTMTLPELEVLAASSPEQLLEEVKRSTAKGFRPHGSARYEGHQILPYRQAMVRHEEEAEMREDAELEALMK